MSEPEDFLSRWSRRKRSAADKTDDVEARELERAEGETPDAVQGDMPAAETKPPAAATKPSEPLFDLKDLPPIESITAATDIRPFLAPGVPAELARAALRRAWTTDPQIRNFVGLADYDWDYHQPGSMGGFGPLEMTDEVRKTLARIIGEIPTESEPPASQSPSPDQGSAENPNDIKSAAAPPVEPANGEAERSQDPPMDRQDVASNLERRAPPGVEDIASQQQPAGREPTTTFVRRNHGRALPK